MLVKLLHHLLHPLVDQPDKLQVDHVETKDLDIFLVTVPETDRGHVLGRDGKTADAIRTIMTRVAETMERDVVIDVLD